MEIVFQGKHHNQELVESIEGVFKLFQERYCIKDFREIHLSVTLVDEQGDDVELVDSEADKVYRVFEVYRKGYELAGQEGFPVLQLVVDNTK